MAHLCASVSCKDMGLSAYLKRPAEKDFYAAVQAEQPSLMSNLGANHIRRIDF
jgi:hypothetical protein